MKFYFCESDTVLYGELVYRKPEYSVDFICSSTKQLKKKSGSQGYMSLTVGTLQIEVGIETRSLLYPWGLLYLTSFENKALKIPSFKKGTINIDPEEPELINGISFNIPESNTWKTILDHDSGWIYMGRDDADQKNTSYIEFASGATLGLTGGDISCILIKPKFLME